MLRLSPCRYIHLKATPIIRCSGPVASKIQIDEMKSEIVKLNTMVTKLQNTAWALFWIIPGLLVVLAFKLSLMDLGIFTMRDRISNDISTLRNLSKEETRAIRETMRMEFRNIRTSLNQVATTMNKKD
jgi:hypothetical protein